MENRKVRVGVGCLGGFVALALGTLLLAGCRSSQEAGYADIPELPGTPVGITSTHAPSNSPPAVSTPPAVISSSPVAPAQPATEAPADTRPAATKVTQKHAPPAEAKSGEL